MDKTKGNIFLLLSTNLINKSSITLLINPNNFIEEIDPVQKKLTR